MQGTTSNTFTTNCMCCGEITATHDYGTSYTGTGSSQLTPVSDTMCNKCKMTIIKMRYILATKFVE